VIPGRNLYVTRIRITAFNTGAPASAVTPTVMQFAAGAGSTAVSLATTDAANTRQPRRIPLGHMAIPVSSIIGASADNEIDIEFTCPIFVEAGTFFHLIMKIPLGVATASQVIRGHATVIGYFD
jgi:hypothetical protein